MNPLPKLLTPISLTLLFVIACSVPAAPAPDAVATRVAEEKAIAATLTAHAPTSFPITTTTFTLTSTPALTPTATSTLTVTPTLSPTPPTPTTPLRATTGQVKGVLVDKDTKQPVVSALISLGPVKSDGSWTVNIGGDRNESDKSGSFLIEDVLPGKYVLLIIGIIPPGSKLTTSPMILVENDAGATLIIEVAAGQVTDIGTIRIELK